MTARPPLAVGWKPFDRLMKLVEGLTAAMNAIGTAWILGIMLLITADVIGRGVFGSPIAGVPEMVALSILGIVFLQLAHALRSGKLTRSDALLAWIWRRNPRIGAAADSLFHLTGAVIAFLVLWSFWPRFVRNYARDAFVGAVGSFTAPLWPIHLLVLLGSAAMLAVFLLIGISRAVHAARGRPANTPDGEGGR